MALSLAASDLTYRAYAPARIALRTLGRCSDGINVGLTHGFSGGQSLDYVYQNRAFGTTVVGRMLDRAYLDTPGWRGIRERRQNLVRTLASIVVTRRAAGLTTRLLDIAAGEGRYLQDLLELVGPDGLEIECRDADEHALRRGQQRARLRGLDSHLTFQIHDALDTRSLLSIRPVPDVIVISGLYEILLDDGRVRASLDAAIKLLPSGGILVLTGQPRHPQLRLIGNVLTHKDGSPWRMRPRRTAELESWCRQSGLIDVHTTGDTQGIFTLTLGRRP